MGPPRKEKCVRCGATAWRVTLGVASDTHPGELIDSDKRVEILQKVKEDYWIPQGGYLRHKCREGAAAPKY